MKAVVATSRMHEGSRRRTDSCEMPGSDKTSHQSSMQTEPVPESPTDLETAEKTPSPSTTAEEGEVPQNLSSCTPTAPLLPSQSPCPDTSTPPPPPAPVGAPTAPPLTRPPLKPDGLKQASVIPKTGAFPPRLPMKSCSVVGAAGEKCEPTLVLPSPPSPKSLSNGFGVGVGVGVEGGNKTTQCQ